MARVFISYATANRSLADEWRRWLAGAGHDVFLDQDMQAGITVGEHWEQRLFERLRWADAVLCVVTSDYVASVWCTAEVAIARSRGSRLLPVLAEPGAEHPLLRFSHYADQVADPAAARTAVGEALRHVDAAGGRGWPDDRSPFPGLRPFEADLHRAFFGRAAETGELVGLLRSPAEPGGAMVLLVGPSGSGKSSLLRAGVRPVLAGEPGWWTLPPLLPGTDPEAALARALAVAARQVGLGWTPDRVLTRLAAAGGLTAVADDLLLACPGAPPRQHLLLVVDQLGELVRFTPAERRRRFAALLRPALAGPVRVVAALRSEFLGQLQASPELADLPVRVVGLRPLRQEALAEVIEGPAGLAGMGLAEGLVARVVADTGTGEALPLLAYTLAELADGVRHGGQLSLTRYERLGGVRGALVKQADAALADAVTAGGRSDGEVVAGLLRLVAVDDQGRPTGRRIRRDELSEPARAELAAFVARRLVSTDAEDGAVMVGLSHERFLSEWPPLAAAITAQASALRARQAVERAAQRWAGADRPPERLWERGQLAAAVVDTGARVRRARGGPVLETARVDVSPQAREFVLTSIRRDRRRRRRATTVLSTLLLVSTAAAGYAVRQDREAVRQRDIAVSRQVASEADGLRRTDSALAMQLALAAYRLAPTAQSRSSLLSSFATPPATRLQVHDARIISLAVRPDGQAAATGSADQTARLSDLGGSRPRVRATLTGHRDFVRSVRFSPDGRVLASGSDDRTVRLWDVAGPGDPTETAVLRGHTGAVYSVAFSPDGRTLASGGDDHTVRFWDVARPGRPAAVLRGQTGSVLSVAFSPDGRTLASGGDDTNVRLWDRAAAGRRAAPMVLAGHTDSVNSVAFSPDGRLLASGSDDRTVRLWDVTRPGRPALRAVLTGHTGQIQSVAFSPDGRILASGGGDRTVRLWDVAAGRAVGSYAQPAPVGPVAFGPHGDTLLAGGADGMMRRWDLAMPVPIDTATSTALSASGRVLATGTAGSLRTWDVTDIYHPAALGRRAGAVTAAAFSPDGHLLATGDAGNAVRLWELTESGRPVPIGGPFAGHFNTIVTLAFSRDGRFLASGGLDAAVRLWDVGDPRLATGAVLASSRSMVRSVVVSPTADLLASSGADGIRLWDIADLHHVVGAGTPGSPIAYTGSIAFSPDGGLLATGSGDAVQLWDVPAERRSASFRPMVVARSGAAVEAVAVSRDGHLLATGNDDRTARLWDITDPRRVAEVATLTGHAGTVRSLAFTPDGVLVSAGDDRTVRLWDTDADRAAGRVCALAGSPMTRAEWQQYIPDLPYDPPCR